ncbi:putative type-I PKS [Anaeromyxobacter dehalogenans 2CP-1]|uniref:Type-I PKS n=1 Tax=Anaeromyxobacter dehalogenans (strain ATCC BAA-258 / DSM 21875 / 2CP-1) TaxID=455488 RepID=B8JHH6_ANAD2|nr:hypothetical protein [Anaeromyxobacter dehalogenans]ACL66688.1 putative type-I PKS [Anaeromyxobacter dehalogenans 2CP-1]
MNRSFTQCARQLAALLLVAPLAAAAQPRDARGKGAALPEPSLQVILRSRDTLGLDAGQVVTLELKLSEVQLRARELVAERDRDVEAARSGPQNGASGPGEGALRGGTGAAPPPGAVQVRDQRLLADYQALDAASVHGIRRIFRPEQLEQLDALLARRAEALGSAQRRPAPPQPGTPAEAPARAP